MIAALLLAGCAAPDQVMRLPSSLGARAELQPLQALQPPPFLPPPPVSAPLLPSLPPPPSAAPPVAPAVPAPENERLVLLRQWVEQQSRLYRVAAPLLIRNAPLCSLSARKILGFTAKNQYSYPSDFVETAHTGLGLDDRLQVASVLPGSGAMVAGIQVGDILVAAGDRTVPSGPNAERMAGSVMADATAGSASLLLTIQRGEEKIQIDVPLTPACAMVIDLGNTDAVGSYADGARVLVTRGMLAFVGSDDELAFVLAREIAFNVVTLAPRADIATIIDRLRSLNNAPQSGADELQTVPTTPVQDGAVDRLALTMLARAGYPLEGFIEFWERLATSYPPELRNSLASLHTPLAERLPGIDRTIKAIRAKQQSGQILTP